MLKSTSPRFLDSLTVSISDQVDHDYSGAGNSKGSELKRVELKRVEGSSILRPKR